MRPTETLTREHRRIETAMDCLERLCDEVHSGKDLDREGAAWLTTFISEYADAAHHGKEEDLLFPAMARRGVPDRVGPVAVMVHEHIEGRRCVAAMRHSLEDLERDAGAERVLTFVAAAEEYIQLLRAHIQKEDHILFAIADSTLHEEDQVRLEKDFRHVDEEVVGRARLDQLERELEALAKRLGVRLPEERTGSDPASFTHAGGCGSGSCGH